MAPLRWFLVLCFSALLVQGACGQGKSPNGPPGPVGNPTPPLKEPVVTPPPPQNPGGTPPQSNPTPVSNPAQTPGVPGGTSRGSAPEILAQPLTTLSPKAKVALRAPNARLLSIGPQISLANVANIRSILLDRIGYGAPALGLWAAANGAFVKEEGSQSVQTAGLLVALDKTFSSSFLAGLCAGFNYSWSPTLASTGGFGGLYATFKAGRLYVTDTVIGGGNAFTTTRRSLLGNAKANSKGFFGTNLLQAGANFHLSAFELGPFASFTYAFSANPASNESGSAANLHVNSSVSNSLLTDLGVHCSLLIQKITLSTNLSWEHEYCDTTSFSTVALIDIPASTTTVSGPSLGHDALILSTSIAYPVSNFASVSFSYDTTLLRKNYSSNSLSLGIKFHF